MVRANTGLVLRYSPYPTSRAPSGSLRQSRRIDHRRLDGLATQPPVIQSPLVGAIFDGVIDCLLNRLDQAVVLLGQRGDLALQLVTRAGEGGEDLGLLRRR